MGVAAAVFVKERLVVSQQAWLAQQGGMEGLPHGLHGAAVVFEQLVIGGQLQLLQNLQGSCAQQGGKPAMEGAYLHSAAVAQQLEV